MMLGRATKPLPLEGRVAAAGWGLFTCFDSSRKSFYRRLCADSGINPLGA